MENVLDTTCKHEFLKGTSKKLNIKNDRPTRLNLGGCKLTTGSLDFDFQLDYASFTEIILKLVFIKLQQMKNWTFYFELSTISKVRHHLLMPEKK